MHILDPSFISVSSRVIRICKGTMNQKRAMESKRMEFATKLNGKRENVLSAAIKLPVARIPWIATKMSESTSLEDTKFYKVYMSIHANAEKTYANRQLYKFVDELFPFYLPKRFHTMDVVALEEKSSSSGLNEYFTSCDAFYFLLSCCLYKNDLEWTIMRHLNTRDYSYGVDMHLMNPRLKAGLFQKGVPQEQCASAAEFILEPWVLSQLLFQPAILHQWIVAVYAEVLQLHAETAALVHLPARPELDITKSVRYIIKMISALDKCVLRGLMVLENSCTQFVLYSSSLAFFNLVMDLLPFLKLVVSKKVSHIIRAAKRLLWNGSEKFQGGNVMEPYVPYYKKHNILYSFKFWQKQCFEYFFVGDELHDYEQSPAPGSSDRQPGFVAWADNFRKKFGAAAKWDVIKKFVDQKILQPGWIQGVEAKDVLKLVDGDMMILYHYLIYIKYEGKSSSAPGIRESDTGILQVIRTLQADNELANALAAMTSRLFMVLMRKCRPADLRLQAVDCEGPHMSMKEILSAVSLMKTKWSTSKLMKQLRDQILAPTGKVVEEQCPNMDTMKVLDIVSVLENRIKKIMFNIVKTFFESFTANQTKVCYEAAFIQYVLPTFVVSFLQSTKNPEATLEDQKRHLSFVHHLIKTFEDPNGLITPLNYHDPSNVSHKKTAYEYIFKTITDDRHVLPVDLGLVNYRQIEIKNELEKPYGETERVPPILMKSFLYLNAGLIEIVAKSGGSDSVIDCGGFKITSPVFQTWTSWMSRYLTRIQFSLQKANHGTETIPVHHRLSQCLTFCNFLLQSTDLERLDANYFMQCLFTVVLEIVGSEEHLDLNVLEHTVLMFSWGKMELAAIKKLSGQQILALLVYHALKLSDLRKYALSEDVKSSVMPAFHLNKIEIALHSILLKDKWRLKQVISEWLNDAEGKTDLSLATFNEVQDAYRCFTQAMKHLTKDGKVKMSYPGEITFFPIKHCRWCGLLDNGKKEMQLCKECQQSPEYPDKCFFCSQECEDKAMENLHTEEHARYLIMKLEISN